MSSPLARPYLAGLDLTFRWGRGDGYLDVLRGCQEGYDLTGLVERVRVDSPLQGSRRSSGDLS